MALDLPPELEPVLSMLGVEWPEVNEDEINRFADELRKLASAIDTTQMNADKAVSKLGEVYHGASADQLQQAWGAVSKFSGLVVEACGITANALSAAALVVEMCKGGAIAQLTVTSGSLATAAVTAPWTTPAIIAAGKQIVSQVLETAVTELGHALAQPVADLVDTAVKTVTGGISAATGGSVGQGFGVDLAQLASCALELRGHADDVDTSGSGFRAIFDGMDLGQPGEIIGKLVLEAAEQIATTVGTEVVKRLLSSLRGTADGMDQVGKNLTENEDQHSHLMSNLLAAPVQLSGLTPGQLGGDTSAGGSGSSHRHASHTGIDSLHPQLDSTDTGTDPSQATPQPTVALQQAGPGSTLTAPGAGELSPHLVSSPSGDLHQAASTPSTAHLTGTATPIGAPGAYGHAGGGGGRRSPQQTGAQIRAALIKQPTQNQSDEDHETPDIPADPTAEDPEDEN